MAVNAISKLGRWPLSVALLAASACSPVDPGVTAARSDSIPTTANDPPESSLEPVETAPATTPPDDDASGGGRQTPIDPSESTTRNDESVPPEGTTGDAPDAEGGSAPLTQAEIDELIAELTADGFCDPDDADDDGTVTAMHFVVQGRLQPPCYVDQRDDGDDVADVVVDDDPRLLDAWESLASITPIELVSDISLVAGYEPCSGCNTLAFVTTLDSEATFFLLAVDVVSGADDPDELRLTMMHELSHVFAQKPGEQLDITVHGPGACDTFYNGGGCFTEDSYLWAWIQEFWPLAIRESLPDDGSVGSDEEADERCDVDPGYTGSYAAVHPEEDFAETFSAYVFDVEVDEALTAKFAFFDRYPEFVAIRENARALGLAGTESNFEGCG